MAKMKFSVSFLDFLFGEKVMLDVPTANGQIIKRRVTKRWLEDMRKKGEIKDIPTIRVHMLHPSGNSIQYWIIGKDIDEVSVSKFKDAETGDLYAMTHFENGEPKMSIMTKGIWEKTRKLMDSV